MTVTRQKSETSRMAMLAKIHIAKKQLCLDDVVYRAVISSIAPGRSSSADLDNRQLSVLLKHFERHGFKAQGNKRKAQGGYQVTALKIRARGLLDKALDEGLVTSASGLVRKICEVDELTWCKDAGKLKRLLAVLESINSGQARGPAPTRGTHAI